MDLGLGKTYMNNIMMLNNSALTAQAAEKAGRKAAASDEARLRDACYEFEQILLGIMYRSMKKTVNSEGLIPKGFAGEVFESMLDDKYMEEAARSGSLGLADMLYRQLSGTR